MEVQDLVDISIVDCNQRLSRTKRAFCSYFHCCTLNLFIESAMGSSSRKLLFRCYSYTTENLSSKVQESCASASRKGFSVLLMSSSCRKKMVFGERRKTNREGVPHLVTKHPDNRFYMRAFIFSFRPLVRKQNHLARRQATGARNLRARWRGLQASR